MSDEELKVQDAIVNGLIDHYKAVIEQYKAENSEDKIIRRTLENFMRGLWEEIQVGELEYTTSEVYEMLEREIFTDNHVTIPSAEPKTGYWIESEFDMSVYCSRCSSEYEWEYDFCPSCGADMRGDDNEG